MVGIGKGKIKMSMSHTQKANRLFESYKVFFDSKSTEEDLKRIPNNLVVPLIRWMSFNKDNLDICSLLNRYFMYVDADVIKYLLFYKVNIDNPYIKYIKHNKSSSLEFLKSYLKSYFSWSEREYMCYENIISEELKKDNVKLLLNSVFGFSQEECKKLGVSYKVEIKKRKDTGSQSLFNFVRS